jgi:hypothetical protein
MNPNTNTIKLQWPAPIYLLTGNRLPTTIPFAPLLSQQKSLLWIIPSLRDLLSGQPVLPPAVFLGTELIASRR